MKENDDDVKRVPRMGGMILAGDVGGSKTILGLFEAQPGRPRLLTAHTYATSGYPDLQAMIAAFLGEVKDGPALPIHIACFGVAGPVQVEHVLSGPGLLNLHRVTHGSAPCPAVEDLTGAGAPAAITESALEGRCDRCVEALAIFVDAYGAEAGNLALRTLATGGLFVAGGIAPKILPALTGCAFMKAFRSKAPFESLLEAVPVKVILNPHTALLGAAVYAADRERRLR